MQIRHRLSLCASLLMLVALSSFTLAACGSPASPTGGNTPSSTPTPGQLTNVSIAFGYIPDIQFAPFYVAQSKGYYKAAGLNVTFDHGFVNDLIGSLALGHDTFVFATGDEELVARSKNLPVFDPAVFAAGRDALYLLTESRSAASPLIAALTDTVMRAGRRQAERNGGRLDPPMAVVLDEAANICRIADLPELYSHLGSRGMVPVTILQSYQQGVSVWGEPGMAAL